MNSLRYILFLIPAMVCLIAFSSVAKGDGYDKRAEQLKAEYIYLQSEAELEENEISAAYRQMVHAHKLDTSNINIAGRLATINISVGLGDSLQMEQYYNTLLRSYLSDPSDIPSAASFIKIAEQRGDYDNILHVLELLSKEHPYRNDVAMQYIISLSDAGDAGQTEYYYKALEICDSLTRRLDDENNFDILLQKLHIYESLKDSAAFDRVLKSYYAAAPENQEVNMRMATIYSIINQNDSAMLYYNRACELDSTYGPAFLGRANLYMEMGDTVGYQRETYNVIKSNGVEFEAKMAIMKEFTRYFMNDSIDGPKRVAAMFETMQDLHPGEPDLHYYHGAFLYLEEQSVEAAEHLGYAIDLDPEKEDYYPIYMDAAMAAGDTAAAINAGRRATRRFDNVTFPLYTSAVISQYGSPKEALALLDSINLLNVGNFEQLSMIYQSRGDLFYQMEMPDSAFNEYDKAIKYNPDNAGAMNNAAYFMAVEGRDLDRALELIERTMRLDGNNPTNIDTYAWVLFQRKDYTEARKQIDRALCYYSDPTDSVEYAIGDLVECNEFGEIYIEEASADVLDHAGDIYFMCGEPKLAVRFWEMALAIEPENEKIKKKVTHKTYFFE